MLERRCDRIMKSVWTPGAAISHLPMSLSLLGTQKKCSLGGQIYIWMSTTHHIHAIVNVGFLLPCLGLGKQPLSEPS